MDQHQALELGQEYIPDSEETAIAEVLKLSRALLNKTASPVQRQQHPKSHGCVKAEFTVQEVPEYLRFGILREPHTYPAWVRFSNGSSAVQSDAKGDVRGMAIKLLGVKGEKLLKEKKEAETQDFILINHPVLFLQNAQDTLALTKALLFAKRIPITPLKPIVVLLSFLPSHRQQVAILKTIRAKKVSNPLLESYWSATPYRLGNYAIKFLVKPDNTSANIAIDSNPKSNDFLRESMVQHLRQEARFKFFVQLQKDTDRMPIEDATVEWNEQDSEPIEVATLRIFQQKFDTPERNRFDENLSFNPWHTLPEHQPLGGVNRLRKRVYQEISELRHGLNKENSKEPTADEFSAQL